MNIIMATGNLNKVRELKEMLGGTDLNIITMKDAGIDVEIEETGTTFEENAAIKAETIRDITGETVIADDSGLEIDFLGGEPGIYSARYMGEDTPYEIKNAALLKRLEGVPDEKRTARFICAIAIAWPCGKTSIFRGVFEGRIAHEPAGGNGFGYDPIFYVPEKGCTAAELDPECKNEISHRGKAMRLVVKELKL